MNAEKKINNLGFFNYKLTLKLTKQKIMSAVNLNDCFIDDSSVIEELELKLTAFINLKTEKSMFLNQIIVCYNYFIRPEDSKLEFIKYF